MKNRNNKIIVAEINHKSTPEMGARVPSIKKPDDADDTINRASYYAPEVVREAQAVPNAASDAKDKQLGRFTPSGSLTGDPTPKPQSGGSIDYEEHKVRTSYSPKSAKKYNSKVRP